VALPKERRVEDRERQVGSRASEQPARTRSEDFNEAATKQPEPLKADERAKESDEGSGESAAESAQQAAPEAEITIQPHRRSRERDDELERDARTGRGDREDDGNGLSTDQRPARRRDKDFDRG
jgi:hypothetical protein